MIALDTDEKMNLFLNGLENGDIIVDSRHMTKEDREEMRREIAEYKAMHQKETRVNESVFAMA